MRDLEKRDYFEHIDFYFGNDVNPYLTGEIYINEDSYCDGMVVADDNKLCFLFGTFRKFDSVNLYVVMSDNKVFRYNGKKIMIRYEGDCSLVGGDSSSSFSMKSSSLEVDPREYWGEKTPKEEFLEKLKVFKENWLLNEKNNELYAEFILESVNKKRHNV